MWLGNCTTFNPYDNREKCMITCNECKHLRFDRYRCRSLCYCRENLENKFSAISGEYYSVKNEDFSWKSNKDGNCTWFEPIKQKWWKKKKVYDHTPFQNNRVDELLSFIREKHPEIIIEFEFTKDSLKRSK